MDFLNHDLDGFRALADLVFALAGTGAVIAIALTLLERRR